MSNFKGTKGDVTIDISHPSPTIVEIGINKFYESKDWEMITLYNAKDEKTQLANANLIEDAFNTISKCDLLPSQLLEQRDEAINLLNHLRPIYKEDSEPYLRYEKLREQLIKKTTGL